MKLLEKAAMVAITGSRSRDYWLGAVAKRKDGAVVSATNLNTQLPKPSAHAEARVLRKADWGSILYVARILRQTGEWAMARPCVHCQALIRHRGVKKVYYTIGPNEYGVWDVGRERAPGQKENGIRRAKLVPGT